MQTCAILEPEKESTSKEERPMKKVLILSGSPRKVNCTPCQGQFQRCESVPLDGYCFYYP